VQIKDIILSGSTNEVLTFSFFSCNFAKLLQAISFEKLVFQQISFAKV